MTNLNAVIKNYIDATNAFDTDAIVATFADDPPVNDDHREFWGVDAIRAWADKDLVGARVTLEPTEVIEHHGTTVVRARYDGDYPKDGLPDPLILTNYFTVANGKIVSLLIIHNQ
jgi:hypothetical protein